MRTPFDTYAKHLALEMLRPYRGAAKSDVRLDTEPQSADLCVVFDPQNLPSAPHDYLGGLLATHTLFEFAHNPPSLATMMSWTQKRDAWWRLLINQARRDERPPPPLPPTLVALSAGDPVEARTLNWMRPVDDRPGCYEASPAGTFRLVVISALPRTRETLLLRTMGAGATLRGALRELEALPPNAPERLLAGRFIARLRLDLKDDTTQEAQEYRMDTEKLVEEMLQKQLDAGRREGRREGRRAERREGLRRRCAHRLGRPLTRAEERTLVARADRLGTDRLDEVILDSSPEALAVWLADPEAR